MTATSFHSSSTLQNLKDPLRRRKSSHHGKTDGRGSPSLREGDKLLGENGLLRQGGGVSFWFLRSTTEKVGGNVDLVPCTGLSRLVRTECTIFEHGVPYLTSLCEDFGTVVRPGETVHRNPHGGPGQVVGHSPTPVVGHSPTPVVGQGRDSRSTRIRTSDENRQGQTNRRLGSRGQRISTGYRPSK